MAVNGYNPYSTRMRISGLGGSGLDTDTIVSQLMRAERVPLDRLYQKKQLMEWKRDAYRDITNLVRGLKDEFFNSLKPTSNLLSPSAYKKFTPSTTDNAVVAISGNADAIAGSHTITVNQLATAAAAESDISSGGVTADLKARTVSGFFTATNFNVNGKDFYISIDGNQEHIVFDRDFTDAQSMMDWVQTQIDASAAIGGKVVASQSAGTLKFTVVGSGNNKIEIGAGTTDDALANMLIVNGATNALADAEVSSLSGRKFVMTLDGVSKTITIDQAYASVAALVGDTNSGLQKLVNDAFGAGKIRVENNGGVLGFTAMGGAGKITLSSASSGDALTAMRFTGGDSNRLNTAQTLNNLRGSFRDMLEFENNKVSFTINGKQFSFDRETTLASMMSQINSDTSAGVNIRYDETADQFKITAKQTGQGNNINIVDGEGNFFGANSVSKVSFTAIKGNAPVSSLSYQATPKSYFITVVNGGVPATNEIILDKDFTSLDDLVNRAGDGLKDKIAAAFGADVSVSTLNGVLKFSMNNGTSMTITSGASDALPGLGLTSGMNTTGSGQNGTDADIILDGQSIARSTNNFTLNGMTINLLKASPTQQTVSLNQDIEGVFNNVKSFVEKYNSMIATINGRLSEKYEREYQPLTDEQKESMKEEDIKRWEEKAKTGLLKNDELLQGIVTKMRSALYGNVDGVSINLSAIGITTGSYQDKGKLIINETKLKEAIQSSPDAVMNLFARQSDIANSSSLTSEQRLQRFNGQGLAFRLSDIIEEYAGTVSGKGLLLQKAGMKGDSTEFTSLMYKDLNKLNTSIFNFEDKLADKEQDYYSKFARLDSMLSRMQSQSQSMLSKLGAG